MADRPLLIFDFDNTLVDTRGVGILAILEVDAFLRSKRLDTLGESGHSPLDALIEKKDHFFREFEKNLRAKGEDTTGKVDIETWRARLWFDAAVSAGVDKSMTEDLSFAVNAVWKESRLKHLKISDPVRQMLVHLRQRFSLCLLTNGNSTVQSEKIERTGAASLFDLVVVSGDHPWEKPAPEIYSFIAEKFRLTSLSDAVMIGDTWDTDMKGGINAAVKALIWIRPKDGAFSREDETRLAEFLRAGTRLSEFSGACHRTTEVLDVPSLLEKIYDR